MGTKIHPGNFDCYHNALPEEPMFILLGRDPTAGRRVREWALARVACGKNKPMDDQIKDALQTAEDMDAYYTKRQAELPWFKQREAEVRQATGMLESRKDRRCDCPVMCDQNGCRPLNCRGMSTPGCKAIAR